MMLAPRDTRVLFALERALHFGRAAEELGMAQPHLSAQVKQIEERIGVALFERRPSVRLTPAGEIVLAGARRAEEDLQSALRQARGVASGQLGAVVVGFASSVMATPLPALFRRFREAHPQVELKLKEMHSAHQWTALEGGALDVGFTREVQTRSRVRTSVVLREPLVAAVPAGHPLAREAAPSMQALIGEPFVLFPPEVAPALYAQILAACTAAGGPPHVVQEADDWHTILAFVREGFGVTLAPAGLQGMSWPGLAWRTFDPAPGHTSLHLCWSEHRPNPARAAFVEFVLEGLGG